MKSVYSGILLAAFCFWAGCRFVSGTRISANPDSLRGGVAATEANPVTRDTLLSDDALPPSASGSGFAGSLPNVQLVNQHGRKLRFVDDCVQNRIVCTFFFYSNCEGTCPGTVQKVRQLRDRVATEFPRTDVAFVGITLDPERDSAQVLQKYAEAVVPDDNNPHEWHFCTGSRQDIEDVRYALGMYDLNPVLDADKTQHAAMIVIGNDLQNRWVAMPSGLSSDALAETFLRIAGQSEKQRFSLTYSTTAIGTKAAESEQSQCCQKTCCETDAKKKLSSP